MGFYILNVRFSIDLKFIICLIFQRLEKGEVEDNETYVAHINCTESPLSWLMATTKYRKIRFSSKVFIRLI